jgi:hypothetical protein
MRGTLIPYRRSDQMIWQQRKKSFHLLNSVLGAHEQGVRRVNDHEVFCAEEGDRTASIG